MWEVEQVGLEPSAVNQYKCYHIGAWDVNSPWARSVVFFTLFVTSVCTRGCELFMLVKISGPKIEGT